MCTLVNSVAQRFKHLPLMQETWVQSLGREDPLEKEMATHSSILAWRIPWMEVHNTVQDTGIKTILKKKKCNKKQNGCLGTSLVAQTIKCLSTMRETWVQSLGREDPLEKEMAIHSSTIAWKIPWTEEPGRLQSMGSQRVGHDRATSLSLYK